MSPSLPTLLALAICSGAPAEPRRPVAWPAGPMEVHVAFPRPVAPTLAAALVGKSIGFAEAGQSRAGGQLQVAAARLADAGRTLILTTDPHSRQGTYSLALPDGGSITYDLSGASASWEDDPAAPTWWPALETAALRSLAAVSPEHERALARLDRPGKVTLQALLTLPAGKPTLHLESTGPILEATLGGEALDLAEDRHAHATPESTGEALDLAATFRTGPSPTLRATFRPEASAPEQPLPASSLILPWAPAAPPAAPAAAAPFAIAGGDPARGEAVFFGKEGNCSNCHRVRGRGGEVGPALDPLAGADPATVYRDIDLPSVVIRPDYVPYTVALKDGRVLVGVVRAEGAGALRVLDIDAKSTPVPRADVDELRPASTSIMPVGLAGALGEAKMRDLVAFLTAKADRRP